MAKHGTSRISRWLSVHGSTGVLLGASILLGVKYGWVEHSAVRLTVLALFVGGCWFGAFLCGKGYRQRMRRLIVRDELNKLRALHWREFQNQIARAFRARGYAVEHAGYSDLDGGLDLVVHKHGMTTLVQCRHWHNRHVELKDVREMHSLMQHHRATAVKIAACGDYTNDAWRFVTGKPFELIYGESLLAMLAEAPLTHYSSLIPFSAPATPPMHHRARSAAH